MSYDFNQPFQNINSMNNNINLNNNECMINNFQSLYSYPTHNSNIHNQFYSQQKINYNNNNDNQDYFQKMKEEKCNEIIKTQKNTRFLQIYLKKINDNNIINKPKKDEEVFIDDYIKLVKEKFEDMNDYFNFKMERGFYNFSKCPFCGDPAVFIFQKVFCINKCFVTSVSDYTFDENYTLDNFMEQYKEFYSLHLNCKSDLMTLYVDKESKIAEFLCCKCQQDYIKLNQEKFNL